MNRESKLHRINAKRHQPEQETVDERESTCHMANENILRVWPCDETGRKGGKGGKGGEEGRVKVYGEQNVCQAEIEREREKKKGCIQRFESARFVTPGLDKVAVRPVLRKKSMYGVSARLLFRACCISSNEESLMLVSLYSSQAPTEPGSSGSLA